MPLNPGTDHTYNSEGLLSNWRQERAFRVGTKISWASLIIAVIATSVDAYYGMPMIVLFGDTVLFFGCLAAIYSSRKSDRSVPWLWGPLYFGVWAATFTSLWVTGGVHSPFMGSYLSLLFVGGLIIQSHIHPLIIAGFTVVNILFFLIAESFYPGHFGAPPPATFNFLIQSLCLAGLMVYIHEFLKTEKNLANELLERYRELEQAQENVNREEAANAAKTAFLANISHELRTPLGAILGYAELIQDMDLKNGDPREHARTILRNGHQLSRLVNDLLDISKIEAGKVEVENLEFDPQKLLQDTLELMKISADKKNLSLELSNRNPLPRALTSDPTRIKQILINIIGNAIKFTSNGRVLVEVSVRSNPSQWIIKIEDTGRGLSEQEQARLFKPFSQADASVTRKYGGTGLGLSLSRRFARLLGGDLELVWSRPGRGSAFLLTLPLDVARTSLRDHDEEETLTTNLPAKVLSGLKVLLVDDTLDNQKLISLLLQKQGASVELASNGEEAIQKALRAKFDAVLMDIQMPVMDGIEATMRLRESNFRKPILALTAHAMKEDRDRCLAAGFDDYLTKPIDRKVLAEKLKQVTRSEYRSSTTH